MVDEIIFFDDLVSVYIITHNRVDLLKRSLNSVREQTYSNIEIIVVNDCSSDETSDYLKYVSSIDKRVQVIENSENMGACFSRNAAIDKASGYYITGLDDDDYFKKERVSDFMAHKSLLESYAFIYTSCVWKTKSGFKTPLLDKYYKNTVSAKDLLYFNFIGNQIFIKTSHLRKVKFDNNLPAWQDLECWYNILLRMKLSAKRISCDNYIQDGSHEHERISNSKKGKIKEAYGIIVDKYNLNKKDSKLLRNHLFSYGIIEGDYLYSILCLMKRGGCSGLLIAMKNIKNILMFILKR